MSRLPTPLLLLFGTVAFLGVPQDSRAQIRHGDVNRDGAITALDALAVLTVVVGKQLPAGWGAGNADADCNEVVTALDALLVLSHVVGRPVPGFACIGRPIIGSWDFEPDSVVLLVGDSVQVSVEPKDPAGFVWLPSMVLVVFGSMDSTVAEVDSAGWVTGIGPGNTEIVAIGLDGSFQLSIGLLPVRVASGGRVVSVEPSLDTVLVGATSTLAATVTDSAGTVFPGAVVSWLSLDTTIATVSAAGVVLGRAPGSAPIVASHGGAADTATVVVVPDASATKTWVGHSDAWGDSLNWSPVGVPTSTDTVFVPAGVAHQPRLSSGRSIAAYRQAAGASLDVGTHQLTVHRYIASGAVITGTGWVQIGTDPRGFGGSFPNVRVVGTSGLNAPTSVSGQIDVQGVGAVLALRGHRLDVAGDFRLLSGNGLFVMRSEGDTLVVGGELYADGADTNGSLTAGLIVLRGNFRAWASHCGTFRPSGSHTVSFSGDDQQTFQFWCHANTSRFHHLELLNPVGVRANSDFAATGLVRVHGPVTGTNRDAWFSGTLVDTAATPLWDVTDTHFTVPPDSFPKRFLRSLHLYDSAYAMGRDLTVDGTLSLHNSARLTLAGHTVTTGGAFNSFNGNTRLVMTDPADTLVVGGELFMDGADTNGFLTAGLIDIRGGFRSWATNCSAFRPSGGHTVRFSGTTNQSVQFWCHASSSRFRNLELASDTLVTINSDFAATGLVRVHGRVVGTNRDVWLSGTLVDTAATPLWDVTDTHFTEPPDSFPKRFLRHVHLYDSAYVMARDLTVDGNLSLHNSATFTLAGHSVTTGGAFNSLNGNTRLVMTDPADTLVVGGELFIDGADTNGFLTAGLIDVHGNFRSWASRCEAFRPSESHTVRFSGTTNQTVQFWCGTTSSRFRNLELASDTLVTLNSHFSVTGLVRVHGRVVGTNRDVWLSGTLVDTAATPLWDVTHTHFTAPPDSFPKRFLRSVHLYDSAYAMGRDLTVDGNLTLNRSARLTLGGNKVTTGGAFNSNNGNTRLVMTDPADTLVVGGELFMDGADTNDWLTAGLIDVRGNFRSWASRCEAFRPSGTHTVRFSGTTNQTIQFWCGTTSSRFRNLELANDTLVTINSDFAATGLVRVHGRVVGTNRDAWLSGTLVDTAATPLWDVTDTHFTAPPDSFPKRFLQSVHLYDSAYAMGRDLTVDGNLTLNNSARLSLSGHKVTTGGNFNSNNGNTRLVMTDPADTLVVGGELFIDGADTNGWLTAGFIDIRGNFRAWASNCAAFRPSGSHTVRLSGSGNQTIQSWCGATSYFRNLVVEGGSQGTLQSTTNVTGDFTILGIVNVNSGRTIDVFGHLDLRAGATLNNSGTVRYGTFTRGGSVTGNEPVPRN